jgi:hypothetical protein
VAESKYAHCSLDKTWSELIRLMAEDDRNGVAARMITGGLGKLMRDRQTDMIGPYEVWVCIWDEGCSEGEKKPHEMTVPGFRGLGFRRSILIRDETRVTL